MGLVMLERCGKIVIDAPSKTWYFDLVFLPHVSSFFLTVL